MLVEYDYQERDRRQWLLAQKASNPVEAYDEMQRAVEASLAHYEPLDPETEAWLRGKGK